MLYFYCKNSNIAVEIVSQYHQRIEVPTSFVAGDDWGRQLWKNLLLLVPLTCLLWCSCHSKKNIILYYKFSFLLHWGRFVGKTLGWMVVWYWLKIVTTYIDVWYGLIELECFMNWDMVGIVFKVNIVYLTVETSFVTFINSRANFFSCFANSWYCGRIIFL